MAGVNVKMGVDVSQFKAGMQQAQNSVKTLDAQLKMNEKQLKATGDAELYAANKSQILNKQMEEQKKVVSNIQKQMEEMTREGIDKTSDAYQKLERAMYNAAGKMMDIQSELNGLSQSEQKAAGSANALEQNLSSINKKVSFDAVIKGVSSITNGLEKAASKAVDLGKSIWDSITDSAKWADDTMTLAQMYEIPLEKYLQMEALVASGVETTVDAIVGGMNKMKKNVGNGTKSTMEALKELGLVVTRYGGKTAEGFDSLVTEDTEDLFFRAGEAIMAMGDAFDKEATAQAIFGKSWRELIPLFTNFQDKDTFNAALETMNINSEEAVEDLADLNIALTSLQHDFDVLKAEVLAGLAPALKDAADALSGLLQSVMDYLKTPEGKKALEDMGKAVSGLFDDLGKIDPEQVVKGFSQVFNSIVGGLQWMVEHKDELTTILKVIVGGWAMAKLTGGALQVLQLINGMKSLMGIGNAAGAAGAAGAASGSGAAAAGAGIFAKAGAAVSGAWTLVIPAATIVCVAAFQNAANTEVKNTQDERLNKIAEKLDAAAKQHELVRQGNITSGDQVWKFGESVYGDLINIKDLDWAYRATNRLGTVRDESGNEKGNILGMSYTDAPMWKIKPMLDELAGWSEEDKERLRLMLSTEESQYTAGNFTWNMLNRYWQGEWFDTWELNALLNTITDALIEGKQAETEKPEDDSNLWAQIQKAQDKYYEAFHAGDTGAEAEARDFIRSLIEGGAEGGKYFDMWDEIGSDFVWALEDALKSKDSVEIMEALQAIIDEANKLDLPVQPTVDDSAKINLQEQIGTVQVPVQLVGSAGFHANGLWNVPWDGYPAILHKGERVLTARENQQYTYNNYFGNVNLNNGLEIDALTESMERRNRRQQAGYGVA